MAIQKWAGCSFVDGAVSCDVLFDDVSLLIQTVEYKNTTASPVAAHVTGPAVDTTFVWPPLGTSPNTGDGSGTTSVSGLGLHMVATSRPAEKGLPARTVYNLPTGWLISFQYPSA